MTQTLLGKATPLNNPPVVIKDTSPTLRDTPYGVAQILYDSGLFPGAGSVAGVYTIVEYGKEVGIPAVVSLQNISIVKGRLCMGGQAMLALARKHGVKSEIHKEENDGCDIEFTRGEESYRAVFLKEDAERADLLGKDNWNKYPKDMYKWRAVAKGCRFIAPDVLGGIYLPEEIESVYNTTDKTTEETGPDQSSEPVVVDPAEADPMDGVSTDEPTDYITDGQLKKFHTLLTTTGLANFKDILRDYLYDRGIVDETKSSKTIRKEDASSIIENYDAFEKKFYANDNFLESFKNTFKELDKIKKATVLMRLKSKVADKKAIPEITTEMEDTMMDDYFSLLLVTIHNEVHNQVVTESKEKGMTPEEVVDTLKELGLKPEVLNTVSLGEQDDVPF
jgi:hypothetical protein